MNKPLLPKGISDFGKLITHKDPSGNNYLIVDKSLLIKEFLESGDEVSLITRPRRFGKTLNMSMLQHFFASEVNNIKTKELFDGLKINKFPNLMTYQGHYSVIFLSLKEIKGLSFDYAYDILKHTISELFESHKYLLDSDKISQEDKFQIQTYINRKAFLHDYQSCLLFLSKLLYKHTFKKVIILLDEYDTPLNDAFRNKYYEEMRGLISIMFSKAFKGNNYLNKAMITGILRIAKSSLFSDLNNVSVYSMLSSSKYSNCFGFTETETKEILKKSGISQNLLELKTMYNGYQIENYTLYNPYSIVYFIDEVLHSTRPIKELLRPYWVHSGGNQIILDLIKNNLMDLEEGLTKLINKDSICTPINQDIILGSSLKSDRVSFWSLLFIAGYLKIIDRIFDDYGDMQYKLLFANEEIRKSMEILLLNAVGENRSDQYISSMKYLVEGNIKKFKDFLEDYMRYTPSYFDTTDRYKEQFFHGLMLGLTACLSKLYYVRSNRESGNGRYDIAIEPKDPKRKGVILEIKSGDKDEELEDLAIEALNQIKEKSYNDEMTSRGIKNIIGVGIAFKKNKVVVKY